MHPAGTPRVRLSSTVHHLLRPRVTPPPYIFYFLCHSFTSPHILPIPSKNSLPESSQELKHRTRTGEQPQDDDDDMNNRRQKKKAMAKRGLRSLAIALSIPLSLTLADISFFGGSHGYSTVSKPSCFPPLWVLHLMRSAFSALMGLSAWLVWADGGFHRKPIAAAMHMGQLALSLAWDPILFWIGESRVGLVVCSALLGCVVACYRAFREVNPIAGELVKPCIAWAAFLTIVNLKLVYL